MTKLLFNTIFSLVALLPLRLVHAIGAELGRLTFAWSPIYAQRLRDNLRQSNLSKENFNALLQQSIREAGKASMELLWVWKRPQQTVSDSVQQCEGWEHLVAAQARGKGVILLTPHWGCFEVIGMYLGARLSLTSLYSPPKQTWLEDIMQQGRARGLAKLAPADIKGVRTLLKALKQGELIIILPDQVPSSGEGEWANFFGKPAYTMTLAGRLARSSGASMIMLSCERLPRGEGYTLRISPLAFDFEQSIPAQINQALEQEIARNPAQYLWSYNRYKTPKGAPPPP